MMTSETQQCLRRVLALWLLVGATAAFGETKQRTMPVDGYAALVNNRIILQSDVEAAAAPHLKALARSLEARFREQYGANGEEPDEETQRQAMQEFDALAREARAVALEALIERYLIVEEFERQEGEIPDRMVDDQMQRIVKDRFGGDRSQLVDTLSEHQMSFEEFKQQTREDLIANLLRRQELDSLPSAAPQTVLDLYKARLDEYHQPAEVELRGMVLIQGETDEEREAKLELAKSLRQRVLDGEDFSTLAKAHSEGSRAESGGDWGWRDPADLRPELAEAAGKTEAGQVSEVVDVKSDDADRYYILKVEARKAPSVTPFSQVRDDLRAEIEYEAERETHQAWIKRLKKHHYVKTFE